MKWFYDLKIARKLNAAFTMFCSSSLI